MKVGIIGAGGMGRVYARSFSQISGVEVYAVNDIDENRMKQLAEEYNVPVQYKSWEDLVEDPEIDAVAVCTPPAFHKEMTVKALKNGKHVICEKPPALNAAEAKEMADEAEKQHRVLMFGFQWRFLPQAEYVWNLARKGFFGEIYRARARYLRMQGAPAGWFRQKKYAGGGALMDIGVHVIDLAWWLTGRRKPVKALGASYDLLGNFEVDDTFVGIVLFDNGLSMIVEASWLQNWPNEIEIKLYGTKAGARVEQLEIYKKIEGIAGAYVSTKPLLEQRDTQLAKIKHFVDIIKSGLNEHTPTGEDAVTVMKIIDALYKSSSEGAPIKID